MTGRKITIGFLLLLFASSTAFAQTEVFKSVVNNLAFYKQKKDLKYLAGAKKSVDSLIKTHADSTDLDKSVYRAVVYSSIVYIDSLNKLKEPPKFFGDLCRLVDALSDRRKIYKYQDELEYCKRCIANVYLRRGFTAMRIYDYYNAINAFREAQRYAPYFKELNAYLAYSSNRLGYLTEAAKYYTKLLKTDSTKAEYIEAAASTYKAVGDTDKALQVLIKGRKQLPDDQFLLLDEANIYSNRKNFEELGPLLPKLLDQNANNAEITFIAANCYDHLGEFDKAESLYLHAIELNSASYDPVYDLGILYFKRGLSKKGTDATDNFARAGQWLERANEISPDDIKCLQLLQMVYAKTGNQDQVDQINAKLKLLTNQ